MIASLLVALRQPLGGTALLAMLGVGATALFLGLFFSAQAGLLFLAAAWVAVGTWRYPWPAFLLLIATAPFLLILKATVVLGPLTVLKDVVILTLFLQSLRGGGSLLPPALRVPVLALVAWDLVTFVRADAFALGLLRLRDLLLYIPLLVIAARQIHTTERQRTFFTVFLGTAGLILLLAGIQRLQFPDSMVLRFDAARQVWIPRVSSVLAHPNHLGGYLVFTLALAAAVTGIRGLPRGLRLGAGILTAAGLVATTLTYSRSAWIAVPVALISAAVLPRVALAPRAVGAAFLTMVLFGSAVLAVPRVRQFVRAVADPAYQSNKTRLEIAAGSLVGISNVGAVIGEGLGDTTTLLQRTAEISLYDIVSAGAQEVQVAKARTFVDNGVVKTWVEQGAIGLVIVGWIAAHLVRLGLLALRHATDPETRAIGVAATAAVCGLAVLWLFLDVTDMFPANLYFWTFAGLVAGARSRS
ncbi:MAG: hypothetical protein G01um101438_512 [Parcubacteria group bacterium Gr01-1014_38]|nr:MAG: hypothetical protein G01um101438_512 [Parcubacteria group bacterium Gr01-1014_38]